MYFSNCTITEQRALEACGWNFLNCWAAEFEMKSSFYGGKRIASSKYDLATALEDWTGLTQSIEEDSEQLLNWWTL